MLHEQARAVDIPGMSRTVVNTLPAVPITPKSIDDYTDIVGADVVDEARNLAGTLEGARVLHINATAFGGGVAELLYTKVPLMRDLGLDAEWNTIESSDDFFAITKLMHNALQGMELPLTDTMRDIYLSHNEVNANLCEADFDFIVVHDPQPLAMLAYMPEEARSRAKWIWRCHLDLTSAYEPLWQFMLPYIKLYDAVIFTMRDYIKPGLDSVPIAAIPPSIDPLSPKNQPLDDAMVQSIIGRYNTDRRRPYMLQVSRFDPWKDPLGVIDVYRAARERFPGLQLVMLSAMASDDPEGWHYYEKTSRHADDDPDIHMLTNMEGIGNLEVNAFQSGAAVVLQKSLREGFGLVVTEALWKAKPVVASPVGGIAMQIVDGETGFLASELPECVDRIVRVLEDHDLAHRLGAAGREYVRTRFISPRNVIDYLKLFHSLA